MRAAIWTDFRKTTYHYTVCQIIIFTACILPSQAWGRKKDEMSQPFNGCWQISTEKEQVLRMSMPRDNVGAHGAGWGRRGCIVPLSLPVPPEHYSWADAWSMSTVSSGKQVEKGHSRQGPPSKDRRARKPQQIQGVATTLTAGRSIRTWGWDVKKKSSHKGPCVWCHCKEPGLQLVIQTVWVFQIFLF